MTNQIPERNPSTTDQILDLLLDALAERQRVRGTQGRAPVNPSLNPAWKAPRADERLAAAEQGEREEPAALTPVPSPRPEPPPSEQQRLVERRNPGPPPPPRFVPPDDEGTGEPPPRLPSINMGKMLWRLALLVIALLVLINIPVTRYGVSLARIMPESSSLIIRDGLILKGSGPEIYRLEDDKLRWISSMDAFEHLRLTWEDVHVVEDEFLLKFEKGRPLHVLLKCSSPHIYRLENEQKRWIRDIDTFLAEGHAWEDVRFVSCQYLRDLPTGPSIPEDAGPVPEP